MADAASPTTVLRTPASPPPALAALVREHLLDAELAATAWILVEGGVPAIVAGTSPTARRLLDALLAGVAPDAQLVQLTGAGEDFAWLPQASELGWASHPASGPRDGRPLQPASTRLVADFAEDGTWGERARIAVRAASIGYALAAAIDADSLETVFRTLRAAPIHVTDDELTRLGLVLVVAEERVSAAHYVRPLARDEHGHVQRLGPAVLATHDPGTDRFEHFGWGITPELAARLGVRAGDLELEIDRRRALLEPPRPH
ncbi:MAG: hypothetical protein ACLGIJ_13245 [Candidatus Limnocylindria bacterium]